ncbi:MAG: NmrA family NAD(P)-binding protein [Alphaproteobacteria bacterium]|nr:NmrA family NAD(P)-binding protein [Alphaproteobacteria bacterium]
MTKPLILVTGATGKTGAPVVEQMLDRGYNVRALVHRLDERSARLAGLGAEIEPGDILDLQTVRAVMQGVGRVYFCFTPHSEHLLKATANIAIAGRDEGIEALVNMSQISAREQADSPLAFQHWQAEQILDWAGIGASHIRPTFFAEDLYLFTGKSIPEEGKIYLPFGTGKHAPVAAADIAAVVCGILDDPEPHVGQRYVVTGPKDMNVTEMADVLSDELASPVTYVDLPVEQWRTALVERAGMPEFLATHLAAVALDHQDGVFSAQTDIVERIGGRAPQSLAEFIRTHISEFSRGRASARAA